MQIYNQTTGTTPLQQTSQFPTIILPWRIQRGLNRSSLSQKMDMPLQWNQWGSGLPSGLASEAALGKSFMAIFPPPRHPTYTLRIQWHPTALQTYNGLSLTVYGRVQGKDPLGSIEKNRPGVIPIPVLSSGTHIVVYMEPYNTPTKQWNHFNHLTPTTHHPPKHPATCVLGTN